MADTGLVYAGPPGSLGDTSTSDTQVSLAIQPMFRIGGIRDLDFGTYDGSGDLALDNNVCVWSNLPGGAYRVTAKGSGLNDAFVVKRQDDETKQIPYQVFWNTTSGTEGNVALTPAANKSGANTQSTTCATGPAITANFQVIMTESALLAARAGIYKGKLTLTISGPL